MLPLTTPLCGTQASNGSNISHYTLSNQLFPQYPTLFPPTLLPPSSSSDDANGTSSIRPAPSSSYPMLYQQLGLSLPPYYPQSGDNSNGFLGSTGKHQGLLPGISNFPTPSLGFPSHVTPAYNSQSLSPFIQYQTNRGSMNDNSSATNNNSLYNTFPFSKQGPFLGGTTQIYPPAPQTQHVMHQVNAGDQLGGQSCNPMNLPNTGRRESASSPSQVDEPIPTTPVSGMEGLQGEAPNDLSLFVPDFHFPSFLSFTFPVTSISWLFVIILPQVIIEPRLSVTTSLYQGTWRKRACL